MIKFELPLTEKIRFFLRIDNLYRRIKYFTSKNDLNEHHIALSIIFEIFDLTTRSDLKTDLMQELEKQKLTFQSFTKNPKSDPIKTQKLIDEIDHCIKKLYMSSGKIGQSLKNNDWLMNIKQRSNIPGGICDFDLPAYKLWSSYNSGKRTEDLRNWLSIFEDVYKGIKIILDILRSNQHTSERVAFSGNYHQSLNGKILHLILIEYDPILNVIPEISYNKYVLNIRFLNQNDAESIPRSKTNEDVKFNLTFCNLNKRYL